MSSLVSTLLRKPILVVEDSQDVRVALCEALRTEGHLVVAAASEKKALPILNLLPSVGLILLAWRSKGVSGAEFLADLRNRTRLAKTPVIALTMDVQVHPAGVQGCVQKPYLLPQILELARQYCGNPHGSTPDDS